MEIAGGINSVISLKKAEFCRLAQESEKPVVIPLSITVPQPGISPVDLYKRLIGTAEGNGPPSSPGGRGFILESMDRDHRAEPYSFLGISPVLQISIGPSLIISGDPEIVSLIQNVSENNAIDIMKAITGIFHYFPSIVQRFSGGFAGYFSYDLVYPLIPGVGASRHQEDPKYPVAEFMLCTECIVFDHHNNTLSLVNNVIIRKDSDPREEYERHYVTLMSRLEFIRKCHETKSPDRSGIAMLNGPTSGCNSAIEEISAITDRNSDDRVIQRSVQGSGNLPLAKHGTNTISCRQRDEFIRSVKMVKKYIREGEIVQAVISRKEVFPFTGDPFALYRALREVNPSPYMYYLDFPVHAVVGASPEMLVRVEGKTLTTVPIAGTRKRGCSPEEDVKLASDLLRDEKERAEHVMLVDLARNDVGSVCSFGSVSVPRFMEIGKYSHVQHIVSTVTGEIKDSSDRFDGLKACFPAGTVTGAPKIRAMQIIDELEPLPRGIYAGAVGYIGFDDQLEFAIAIRTADIKDGIASVQAGAGIVADSCPSKEWIETNDKAEAMRSAIRAAGGLA